MFLLKLLIRNSLRHPLRAGLTILGVAIAIVAFGLLRTLVDLWYAGVEASSASRLITRNAISLVFPLPITYAERIRRIPGVRRVSWGNWFGGVYRDERNFFPSFAIEPGTYFPMYPEYRVDPNELSPFLRDRKGAIVGRKTAERFGWKVGDPVTLRGTIFPGEWEFTIRGIYRGAGKSTDETQFFFHWDHLNEVMRKTTPRRAEQTGFFIVEVKRPEVGAEVARQIDVLFTNSLAETLTETERAFQMSFVTMTEAILIAVKIVSYVVIVIIMVVAANTMAMTARERIGEYATMKTLGFGPHHIAGAIVGESLLISLSGGVVGVAATFPAARWIETELSQFFPIFTVDPSTILLQLTASVIVGGVAAIFPTVRGITVRIADGLRRVG
ncbi:MAG: ABC transporter permease [Desulfuromonadia bacterium]